MSDVDPFSDEFLADPYAAHAALRAAGPVVWLSRYRVWGMARHESVQAALADHGTYCSGGGIGLTDFRKEPPWRPPSIILEADPPDHTRARNVLARILSPAALRGLRETFVGEAERLVEGLVARGTFDAVADLGEPYPCKVFPDAVGLPEAGRREMLLAYGRMVFNGVGPRNRHFDAAMAGAGEVAAWIASRCARESLTPGGLGDQIYAAADAGELTMQEAAMLVRSFLSAGVDTTVNGIGAALHCFVRNPGEWDRLRADPALARGAFEEVIRYEAPVQNFFRTTTRPVRVGDVQLGEGEKVLLFYAAANRDERRWAEPDQFDITRKVAGHLGYGGGIHGCVGQMVARLEGEAVLTALARRVIGIEAAGPAVRRLNNSLRGLASLPVRVH